MDNMSPPTLKLAQKTSSFIAHLTPEPLIPSISKAIELFESDDNGSKIVLFHTPRQLSKSGAYQFSVPTKRKEHQYLISSPISLKDLNLDQSQVRDQYYQDIVSGKEFYYDDKIFPYAQAYAGFQFGHFAGQLGDGRVHNLFQLNNPETGKTYELQLKGSGKTAFSRFADGKAVLRSSVREFIVSEALNGLRIPSIRSLSLSILPGTYAQRNSAETCAVISRFAESWIRIGSFDYYRMRQDRIGLRALSDYVLNNVLTELPIFKKNQYQVIDPEDDDLIEIEDSTRYDQMYRAIVRLNARTVAYWQVYGFINGVLNTDNTSIIGLSLDFGPFNFLDKFDPNFSSNSEDELLRYSYENQPSAIWWNLTRLGESLIELLGAGPDLIDDEKFIKNGVAGEVEKEKLIKRANSIIRNAGKEYKSIFFQHYNELFGKRLGLKEYKKGDEIIYEKLLSILTKTEKDYNKFFLDLQNQDLSKILTNYEIFMSPEIFQRFSNPEDKIDKELQTELTSSFKEFSELYHARLLEQSISPFEISSHYNPLFLPRSWIFEDVIQHTSDNYKEGDTSYLSKLLKMSSNPYDPTKWGDELKDLELKWLGETYDIGKVMQQCSCSS
ncbi:hypothetical protein WICMUC_000385 [Wickerhamomyces mucosus]|uniref:Selenoprotein O n=1 Tax=Wickerhamomyces mucosus TaxID=1378264 RepID=A0A9P8PXV0_9ASCO|nr:hypothetical protein WICMUC_000385 [Wickerhamomyces mucosus]